MTHEHSSEPAGPQFDRDAWIPVQTLDDQVLAQYPRLAAARVAAGRAPQPIDSEDYVAAFALDEPEGQLHSVNEVSESPDEHDGRITRPLPRVNGAESNQGQRSGRQNGQRDRNVMASTRRAIGTAAQPLAPLGHAAGATRDTIKTHVGPIMNTWRQAYNARHPENQPNWLTRGLRGLGSIAVRTTQGYNHFWDNLDRSMEDTSHRLAAQALDRFLDHEAQVNPYVQPWAEQVGIEIRPRRAPLALGRQNRSQNPQDVEHDNNEEADHSTAQAQPAAANRRNGQRGERPPLTTDHAAEDLAGMRGGPRQDRAVVPRRNDGDVPARVEPRGGHPAPMASRVSGDEALDEVQANPSDDFYTNEARRLYDRDRDQLGNVDAEEWIRMQAISMRTDDQNNGSRMIGRAIFNAQRQDPAYQQEQTAQREAAAARDNDPYIIEAQGLYDRDEHLIPEDQRSGWVERTAHGLREIGRQKAEAQAAEERTQAERRAKEEQAAADRANQIADTLAVELQRNAVRPAMPANTGYIGGIEAYEVADGLVRQVRASYPEQWKARGLDNQAARQRAVRATAATLVRMNLVRSNSKRLVQAAFAREMLGMEIAAR